MIKYDPNCPSKGYSPADLRALRNSPLCDTIAEDRSLRFDTADDASVFFARELDFIKSQSYDQVYPEFTALKFFPHTSDTNPGAETVTYYGYDITGFAKIISNYATDLPRADVIGKPSTAYVKSIGDSFGYSVQEMRASRFAGKSLDARKAKAARYAIDRKLNELAWAGDSTNNIMGVLTTGNNIPTWTVPNNAGSTSTTWASKTAAEILADITAMQTRVSNNTMNVERPDTLLLPTGVFMDIANRKIADSDTTVLQYILKNAPYLKTIEAAAELNDTSYSTNPFSAANAKVSVAFFFTKNMDKFSIEDPMAFYQHPLQTRNLEVIVPCEARTAGALIYYPLSALIVTGI